VCVCVCICVSECVSACKCVRYGVVLASNVSRACIPCVASMKRSSSFKKGEGGNRTLVSEDEAEGKRE